MPHRIARWLQSLRRSSARRGRRAARPSARPWLERLDARQLLASITLSNPAGPITRLIVGDDGSFQVERDSFASGQIFPPDATPPNAMAPTLTPGDAAFFVRQADGAVVGMNLDGRPRTAATATRSIGLRPISFEAAPDGRSVTLVADNGLDAANAADRPFRVREVFTLLPGDEFFRVDAFVTNTGTAPLTGLDLFAAADFYLADSDFGVGYRDPSTGAVGGVDRTGQYRIFVQPNPSGGPAPTNFQEGPFDQIWQAIGTPLMNNTFRDLNNSVMLPSSGPPYDNDPAYLDNGAGIQWADVSIAPGDTTRVSYFWAFGLLTSTPVVPTLSVQGQDFTVNAGEDYSGIVAHFDADPGATAADFSALIRWGDDPNVPASRGIVTPDPDGTGFVVVGTHRYDQGGSYTVHVDVTGPGGGSGSAAATATVLGNEPPPSDLGITAIGLPIQYHLGSATPLIVATFVPHSPGSAGDFAATVDWGEGLSPTQGVITPRTDGQPGFVVTAEPPYATAGVRTARVTIARIGGDPAGVDSVVTVLPTLDLSGGLDPASDSGASNSDRITNVSRPHFLGQATPGATVRLVAAPVDGSSGPITLGDATVGGDGSWSITPAAPLADGAYTVTAYAMLAGDTIEQMLIDAGRPLVLDTNGPKVTGLTVQPRLGRMVLTLQDDRSGLDPASLADPSNYSFTRRSHPRMQRFPLVVEPGTISRPTGEVAVRLSLAGGRRITHGLRFVLAARSGANGLQDLAGNPLDGEFRGRFPTGEGHRGGTFLVNIQTDGIKVLPLKPAGQLLKSARAGSVQVASWDDPAQEAPALPREPRPYMIVNGRAAISAARRSGR